MSWGTRTDIAANRSARHHSEGEAHVVNETEAARPWSVSQLTARIKESLETDFSSVWVSGELSDVARPQSGHVYLTLKDPHAQLRGVIWRGVAATLKFDLRDGQEVVCFGDLDVYAPRGVYQLIIRKIAPLGVGALELALRQLQQRLAAEGLFDPQHKKPLPRFPRRIAFVTSPTGAAIHDFLEVLRRRWQGVDVLIVPAKVQGEGAAEDIVRGIRLVNALADPPDVLVVGRGGGSLEDLWCFNEEAVVRAIYASRVPVVSAVGHEIDVTLADLVADVRALTPSDAALRVVPSADEVRAGLAGIRQRLIAALRGRAAGARTRLTALAQHRVFRRPFDRVRELARRLDELGLRGERAIRHRLTRSRDCVAAFAGKLDTLSPLAVLRRGYSLTQRAADGRLVSDAAAVSPGERILSRLSKGQIISTVDEVHREA
jgi:exodeoxyribonuclease VII large subunit